MTFVEIFVHVLSALVLAGVACRLLDLNRTRKGDSSLSWHAWVVAHVLIGLAMVARLFRMEDEAVLLVTVGLALYFGVRWQRRSGER